MGGYLASPVTDKISSDATNVRLDVGVSSMQGWRDAQEDSHNCELEFDANTSLFAVYDGHGGSEVAQYCSTYMPSYIRNAEKDGDRDGNVAEALVDAFLRLDKSLVTRSVLRAMQREITRAEVDGLLDDARTPIHQVMAKYQRGDSDMSIASDVDDLSINEPEERNEDQEGKEDPPNLNEQERKEDPPNLHEQERKEDEPYLYEQEDVVVVHNQQQEVVVVVDNDYVESESESESESNSSSSSSDENEDEETKRARRNPVGFRNGCTAIVALVRNDELFVANAGDSRCVVCQDGRAIEMSRDHKPEDYSEKVRIENAGGHVTWNGRVNGGLNLSRAIGDHSYKTNEKLDAKDQMISALPDVRSLKIDCRSEEFMVVACDGIWNCMNSQRVVEFVRGRLLAGPKNVSTVCEQLMDECLSPDKDRDGSGCDNMTCIVVKFKSSSSTSKRHSRDQLENENKRMRKNE